MAARLSTSTSTATTNKTTTTQSTPYYSPYPSYNPTLNPHHNHTHYQNNYNYNYNYNHNDQQYQPTYNPAPYQSNYVPSPQGPQALSTPPFPLNTKSSFTSSTCPKKPSVLATKVKKFFSAFGTPPTRDYDENQRNAGAIVLGSEILGTAYHEATHDKVRDVRGDGWREGCRKVG